MRQGAKPLVRWRESSPDSHGPEGGRSGVFRFEPDCVDRSEPTPRLVGVDDVRFRRPQAVGNTNFSWRVAPRGSRHLPASAYPVIVVKDMSLDELDAALTDLSQRRCRALREDRPAEEVGALEACQVAVTNELRRRGL